VLIRNTRLLKEAATGRDYSAADRIALAIQPMMILPLMLHQVASNSGANSL